MSYECYKVVYYCKEKGDVCSMLRGQSQFYDLVLTIFKIGSCMSNRDVT
jgi:hypothetical protein